MRFVQQGNSSRPVGVSVAPADALRTAPEPALETSVIELTIGSRQPYVRAYATISEAWAALAGYVDLATLDLLNPAEDVDVQRLLRAKQTQQAVHRYFTGSRCIRIEEVRGGHRFVRHASGHDA